MNWNRRREPAPVTIPAEAEVAPCEWAVRYHGIHVGHVGTREGGFVARPTRAWVTIPTTFRSRDEAVVALIEAATR